MVAGFRSALRLCRLTPRPTRPVRQRPALPPHHPTGVHGLTGGRAARPGLDRPLRTRACRARPWPLIDAHALPAVLDEHREYYRLVLTTAQAGLRDGPTPLQAARACRLGPFADLPDAERIVLNLHRAYADTIAFNAGPLHTQV